MKDLFGNEMEEKPELKPQPPPPIEAVPVRTTVERADHQVPIRGYSLIKEGELTTILNS